VCTCDLEYSLILFGNFIFGVDFILVYHCFYCLHTSISLEFFLYCCHTLNGCFFLFLMWARSVSDCVVYCNLLSYNLSWFFFCKYIFFHCLKTPCLSFGDSLARPVTITNTYLRYISRNNKFVYSRFKKRGVFIIHTPSTCRQTLKSWLMDWCWLLRNTFTIDVK
jgi:hypothetical protein